MISMESTKKIGVDESNSRFFVADNGSMIG